MGVALGRRHSRGGLVGGSSGMRRPPSASRVSKSLSLCMVAVKGEESGERYRGSDWEVIGPV